MKLTKEQVIKAVDTYRELFGLPKKYKYVAVDFDGAIAVYTKKPEVKIFDYAWLGSYGYTEWRCIIQTIKLVSNWQELCFKIEEVAK